MLASVARPLVRRNNIGHFQKPRPTTSITIVASRNNSSLPPGYVEDRSKGAMLRFQDSLPRLPVPTLEQTAKRYLKSLHPILSPSEYAVSKAAVEDFIKPDGIGRKLQEKLVSRREDPAIKNWIHEWWNNDSYLSHRDPVVPNLSWFFSYKDDHLRRDPAKRAASITSAVLEFKKMVDTGVLEPEYMKRLPICMDCYKWLFNATRIAARPSDFPTKFAASESAHLVAIRKNQFFKIPHHVNGKQVNTSELEKLLNRVYEVATEGPAVGALTSENRDVWANARELLARTSSRNGEALCAIDSASFVVCLDDASPVTLEERAHQYWHGDGANRWFDKPLQFIVNDNGTAGFMGEHSMMDGTPMHRLSDWLNNVILNGKMDFSDTSIRTDLPEPQLLQFDVTAPLQAEIDRALTDLHNALDQHQLAIESYQGYGKGLIKKFGCSPDAYVQMVIQLAYFKMHGMSRPTYESAATRRFQLGRTETCRTVSDESVAWCTSMNDPLQNNGTRIGLFRKATDAHVEYLKAVADGKGVDRHFFGLKKLLQPDEETPAIFKDPAFTYSSSWYMSTSQLSSEFYNAFGYSQDNDVGFGIAYNINENSLNFNVVSKGLGSDRLAYYLFEAAGDVRDLMLPTLAAVEAKL